MVEWKRTFWAKGRSYQGKKEKRCCRIERELLHLQKKKSFLWEERNEHDQLKRAQINKNSGVYEIILDSSYLADDSNKFQ